MKRRPTLLSCLIVLLATASPHTQQRTLSDGVYSAAQAERGRERYETVCQTCHGLDLSGGVGSALKGEDFVRDWSGLPLKPLFDRVRTMPPGAPQPLADDEALDILAHLLSHNGFPAGEELSTAALESIQVEARTGPETVPNFALVHVVGCLTRGTERDWLITAASDPVRTKDPNPSTGDDRSRAQAAPAGTHVFRAQNVYPSPDALTGHRVEVKGLLIRGAQDALNVTALSSLSPTCR